MKKIFTLLAAVLLSGMSGGLCLNEVSAEEYSALAIPDFIVEVENGRDPIVLQLTDPQVIDAAQERYESRLDSFTDEYWDTDQVEKLCYRFIRETVETVQPDLILLTGDIIYGEFDDAGTAFVDFVEFMDGFGVPWAPIFGNHDNESKKGVDWQCEQFVNAEHCLFEQKTLTGNGNYSVGIAQGGELKRVFYMLDSNGCAGLSAESNNGHSTRVMGFGQDQIDWFTEEITTIKGVSPETKISFAYHIPQAVFAHAAASYGFNNTNRVEIDLLPNKAEGDFGIYGANIQCWDTSNAVWNIMKELGGDSVFVGHEHCNSASVMYEGVRLTFGQKSSMYDKANYLSSNNDVVDGWGEGAGLPLMGGTVIPLSEEDGAVKDPYIYYCKEGGGNVLWEQGNRPQIVTRYDLTIDNASEKGNVRVSRPLSCYDMGQKLYISVKEKEGYMIFTTFNDEWIFPNEDGRYEITIAEGANVFKIEYCEIGGEAQPDSSSSSSSSSSSGGLETSTTGEASGENNGTGGCGSVVSVGQASLVAAIAIVGVYKKRNRKK